MRFAAAVAVIAVCARAEARAQVPGLAAGDTIRYTSQLPQPPRRPAEIQRLEQPRVTGWRVATVAGVTTDSLLTLAPRSHETVGIHLDSIYALDVSRGRLPRMQRMRTWGTAGVLSGLVVGALTAGEDIRSVVSHLGMGIAVGLAAGAVVSVSRPGARRWVELRIPACRPQPGRSCATTSGPAAQPH